MDRAQENREKADEQAQQQRGRMLPPPPPPHLRRHYAQQRMDADAAFQRQIQHQGALAREREQARQQSFVPDTCQAPNTNTNVLPAPATHLALPALPPDDAMRQQQAPKPVKKKPFQQHWQRRYQQKHRYHQQRHQHQKKKQRQSVKKTPSQQQHQWHYQQNQAPHQQLAHAVVRAPEPVPYQVQRQWYQRQRSPLNAQELAQLQQYLQYHEQQYAQLPDIASDDGSQGQLQRAQPQQFQQGVQHYSTVTGGGHGGGELGQHQQQQESHWQQQQYQQQECPWQQQQEYQQSHWQQQQYYQQYQLQPVNLVPAQGPVEYQPQQIQQGTWSEGGDQWMPHHYSTVTGSGHGSEELGQYHHHQELYQQPHLRQAQHQYQHQLPVANPSVGQEPAPYHPHQPYHEQAYEQQAYQQQQQYQQYQLKSDHPMPAQLPVPYQQQPYQQPQYQHPAQQQQPYQQLYQHYPTTDSGNGIDGPIQHVQPPVQQFQQGQHYYSTVPGDEDSSNRLQNSLLNLPTCTFGDGPPVPSADPDLYMTGRVDLRAPPPATYEAHDPFMGYVPPTPRTAAEAEYDADWGMSPI